ncbi:hypothetical protein [Gilvimarinus agarilyticus]|uniref:hypothetical protein n=1 Tax=Gilvimarinus agarilyticus TaxID=679259 RepID=UPI0005A2327E|nr:hypothetical protein [Gilvimarinus agarilyticus]
MRTTLLAAISVALLAGCGSDNDSNTESPTEPVSNTYLQDHAGVYQSAYVIDNQAILAQLVVNEAGAVLVTTNALEQSSSANAALPDDISQLDFASTAQCSDNSGAFDCTIAGQTVTLRKATDTVASISSLAGEYQLQSNNELTSIQVADSGEFLASINGCELNGQLSIEADAIVLKQLEDSCGEPVELGVAFNGRENSAPESLEVYISSSALTGDWIKR